MLATARTDSSWWAAAITAAPPKECPTRSRTSRPEFSKNRAAWAVSATLCENEPSPQSPSESPSPRLSKRNIPIPSLPNCLQIRLAAGLSLPRVKPCENTPQPRTGSSGWSMRPASRGPLELGNHTRSATSCILPNQRGERCPARGLELLRRSGRRPMEGPDDDFGEARDLDLQVLMRGYGGVRGPGRHDRVPAQRPGAGYDSTDDHDIGAPTDIGPDLRRHHVDVGSAGAEHPLVVLRQEPHGARRTCRSQVVDVLAQHQPRLGVDLDRAQPAAEASDPLPDQGAAHAQTLPQPVLQVVCGSWAVRPQVGLDRASSGLVEIGQASPSRVPVEALERHLALAE